MSNMKYLVTKDIDAPATVQLGIKVFDIFFVLAYSGIAFALKGVVHPVFQIPYILYSVCMAVFLTMPSRFNRRRRNYESLLFLLHKDKTIYRPIYTPVDLKGEADEEMEFI